MARTHLRPPPGRFSRINGDYFHVWVLTFRVRPCGLRAVLAVPVRCVSGWLLCVPGFCSRPRLGRCLMVVVVTGACRYLAM